MTNIHIYIYTLKGLGYPRGRITIFAYIPGAIWTIRHFADTLVFKDHCPHNLRDLAERYLIFITIIIFRRGGDGAGRSDENCELNP